MSHRPAWYGEQITTSRRVRDGQRVTVTLKVHHRVVVTRQVRLHRVPRESVFDTPKLARLVAAIGCLPGEY